MNMPARKRLTRRVGTVLILLLLTALLLGAAGTSAMPNRLPAAPVNAAVTTPRDFFGYDIGQDYKLTPWQTHVLQGEGVRKGIVEYANELQRTSPRVRVFQYGTTEEGRPMIMTVITSPQNWAQINDLKGILKKLADPRQVASDAEAKFLAQRGKAVYWISPAIHATERTSPEVGVRLSYRLASDEDAWTRNLLDNVIVVIEGTLNPDGLEMVTDWYYKYKDTAYANSSPPYYNKYINHDNNRDFLGMGIAETRANTAARFEWNPTLYHDLHQTQNMLFMYPAMDPTNLAVNAITVAEWLGYGGHTLTGLIAKGWTGVFLYDYTDNWYPGYNDIFSFMHNTMGTLYELRGANMATPIVMTATPRGRSWYNPAPYTPGFTWRLIDAVNLEEDAIRLKLGYLAQNKDDLLYNFYLKGKLNYQKSAGEPPYAFMIPANGGDNVDVTDLINNLHLLHRIEVDRLAAATTIAGQQYQAGDYVVRADQPYGLTAKNYLATPPYPGGQTPFDVVSWDYGLLRDVQVVPVTTPLPAGLSLIPVTLKIPYAGSLTGDVSGTYVIEHQSNNNLAVALPQLWADPHMGVAQADAAFTSGGRTFPAGTFVVTTTGSPADHAKIKGLAESLGLTAYAVTDSVAATPLHPAEGGALHAEQQHRQHDARRLGAPAAGCHGLPLHPAVQGRRHQQHDRWPRRRDHPRYDHFDVDQRQHVGEPAARVPRRHRHCRRGEPEELCAERRSIGPDGPGHQSPDREELGHRGQPGRWSSGLGGPAAGLCRWGAGACGVGSNRGDRGTGPRRSQAGHGFNRGRGALLSRLNGPHPGRSHCEGRLRVRCRGGFLAG